MYTHGRQTGNYLPKSVIAHLIIIIIEKSVIQIIGYNTTDRRLTYGCVVKKV